MVPDYYAMLGVDPTADRATLEAALSRCQPQWSSGTRNPKNKHTFQSYLDQIPALRRTLLGEATTRAAYDAELAATRRAERDRALDALQRWLRLRSAKGGLTVSDRTMLREKALALGLSFEDLDRLAESIPPRPEPVIPQDEPDPPLDVIDSATRRQVRVALEHLRRRDLYDVLGLPRDATIADLLNQADADRQHWMRKSQVTAEKTAWLEVISYAQSHLGNPQARARYDRTLVLEAEETLNAAIEFAAQGLNRLDPGTRGVLLEEAAALGITPDRAERLIARVCRRLGVGSAGEVAPVSATAPTRQLRCRSCAGLTEFAQAAQVRGAAACRHCAASLRWTCPVCQEAHWVDEPRCRCGFPIEQTEPLIRHFEAAQHAHRRRDFKAALAHLRRVQEFAPQHVGARKGVQKVQEHLAAIEQAKSSYELEIARHHLVGARRAAEAWVRLVAPDDPEPRAAWSDVMQRLRQAHVLTARARKVAASDPAAARDLFVQALAIAADLADAREGLGLVPPDPPTDLNVRVDQGRVRLRWSAPKADGLGPLSYLVVRKRQGRPQHSGDGLVLAELAATEFDDLEPLAGESVGYAVFSRRGGMDSALSAGAGPSLILADVANLVANAGQREINLSWSTPESAVEVRVVRKVGSSPTSPLDGEPIEALRDQASDRAVQNDRVYHYGVYAYYRGVDGRLAPSRGVVVSATPHPPIEPPGPLSMSQEPGGRIRLRWPEPPRGRVEVLRTLKPLAVSVGDRLTVAQAKGLDGTWLEVVGPDVAVDPRPPASGVCSYTPLTLWAGLYTVGLPAPFSCIPDPSDLRAVRVGNAGRVHLRWRWSPQGSQSLIMARAGQAPAGADDPEALRFHVLDVEYSQQGYHAVTLPSNPPGPWHLSVYSLVTVDGEPIVSPGLEPTARTIVPGPNPEVVVSYTIRPLRFPGRGWSLTFRTDPPDSAIPPTALVANPRAVPLSADDGQIIDQFPATRDGATFRLPIRLDPTIQRARVFADPRAEPDGLMPIRLRHPEVEDVRV